MCSRNTFLGITPLQRVAPVGLSRFRISLYPLFSCSKEDFATLYQLFFPCRPLLSRVYLLCALRDPQKPQGLRELRHYPVDSFVFAVVKINKYNFLRVDLNFLKDKNMEALNKAIFQCQSSSDTLHPLSPDSSWSVRHTASIQFQSLKLAIDLNSLDMVKVSEKCVYACISGASTSHSHLMDLMLN